MYQVRAMPSVSEAETGNHQTPTDARRSADDQVVMTHKKSCLIRGLTPELSRTAQRRGVVVHDTALAEPRSGLGLNE